MKKKSDKGLLSIGGFRIVRIVLFLRTTTETRFCFRLNKDDFEDELQFEYDDGKVDKEDETLEERDTREPDTELTDKGK